MAKRPDWSRALPQRLIIPGVMTLATLADVRKLISHLPKDYRDKPTWQHVADELNKAAADGDVAHFVVGLRMVFFMERVECRTLLSTDQYS